MTNPLEALPLTALRERSSVKWRRYADDVLPLFVAETDYPLAPAITRRLARAVELGDTGYTFSDGTLTAALRAFAKRQWDWDLEGARIRSTCDVIMGIVEVLRRVTAPGDRIVVTPPVYPPFYACVPEAGAEVLPVPLREERGAAGSTWRLDLPGIEEAFRGGARGILLCNPHNPTGTAHSAADLAELARIAERHGAVVLSDEIHGPIALEPGAYTPFLTTGEAARRVGFAFTSASKAFNLAGLKCAFIVTAGAEPMAELNALPAEVEWRTSLFGALAAEAALAPESDAWLESLRTAVADNHALLARLLAEHVPGARFTPPDAGYLAWVDLTALGWGDDPARRILRDAKVALHYGPQFGIGGAGHVRVNVGCAPEVLTEAIERIGALVAA